ncbi:MAG: hypothetical protein KKA42_05665 [candidate division Zixibacteria bacterium]|nr:hypothetical protein [candidate division Zixibacteria bacterium]
MTASQDANRNHALGMVNRVDDLSDDVKDLALNLALYLAKIKASGESQEIVRLEPEFVRLVNGAVKVVQELAIILSAAKNEEVMAYEPQSGRLAKDHIERKLENIVHQCNTILSSLGDYTDITV